MRILPLALLLASGAAFADDAADLKAKLAQFDSFSAHFSQKVTDSDGNLAMEAEGQMAVERPQKLYWHTQSPDETLLVSDGNTLWLYNPFVEQVTLYSPKEAVGRTPMLLLSSQDPLVWSQFTIKAKGGNYDITPKDEKDAYVTALTVKFSGDKVAGLVIHDASGQLNTVTFSGFEAPRSQDGQVQFSFTPPQGVAVDDQR
ncbi:outer membrane lipoprotein chaperone LolA [Gallaecimonas xiamenensis]|uniref:Outer-membrane lipoprotein carrier protein n=1 Tax=Gallaecimonas xiamenensis 3-C-1 TaxID=745411 RepID=K2K4U8_9GAMM|nr:outer membrane lipoprotein chaperone LolA [Gallaecimonas xiamenensis]EKE77989.1 lipoprotein chaperone [Gallaecimonas xiamenensis 3-C-1]